MPDRARLMMLVSEAVKLFRKRCFGSGESPIEPAKWDRLLGWVIGVQLCLSNESWDFPRKAIW
jgi:hypothetical protein